MPFLAAGAREPCVESAGMTYKQAVVFGLLAGLGIYIGIAAGRNATAASAVPYGLASAVAVTLFMCGVVAYRNGQPNKR